MCGFAGLASQNDDIDASKLEELGRLLSHRGPDQAGVLQADGRSPAAGLATRRLAILDLSPAGAQPMVSGCSGLTIAYNGEIYNYQQLKAALEAKGHAFRSRTDTEMVLHAYEEWGDAAFRR